jgi:hypothetical protein
VTSAALAAVLRSREAFVQYHVRSARLTDVDAAIRILMRGASDPGEQRDDADHLRSLLFLPAATVLVAESGRQLVGIGVLSIRPSVRPGPFVGVIDELGVAAPTDGSGGATNATASPGSTEIGSSILEQLITSARNKGCARVEVTDPLASAEPELLGGAGFERRGALLSRTTG